MNKKEFKDFIAENLNCMSLERQIKELQKIQNVYLPEILNAKRKKAGTWVPKEEKDKYIFCNKCKKYHLKKKWKEELVKEVRTVETYRDAGYGDDDRMGYVEYMVSYHICPVCHEKTETRKYYIQTLKEWNRREGIK